MDPEQNVLEFGTAVEARQPEQPLLEFLLSLPLGVYGTRRFVLEGEHSNLETIRTRQDVDGPFTQEPYGTKIRKCMAQS